MYKIINNTLIYLAFVSSLILILNKEHELFLTIFCIGLLVSYITKDMLVIIGAAFAFVYLNEYNSEKEGFAEMVAGGVLGLIGGIGGYYIGKEIDPTYKPPKYVDTDTWIDKIRDKTFPGIFGNDTENVVKIMKKRQKNGILNLIGMNNTNIVGGVQQNVECLDGKVLKPNFAEKTGKYSCLAGADNCCAKFEEIFDDAELDEVITNRSDLTVKLTPANWMAYVNGGGDAGNAADGLGVPCWARITDVPNQSAIEMTDNGCNYCEEGQNVKYAKVKKCMSAEQLATMEDDAAVRAECCVAST